MLKRKIVFGILLVVLLALNVMFVDYELWAVLVFCISFAVVQYALIFITSKRIVIDVNMPTNIVAGNDTSKIVIKVRNKSIIHITKLVLEVKCRYMNTGEAVATNLCFSMKGKEEQTAVINVDIKYSGNLYVSVRKAIIYDALMIFKKRIYCLRSKSINVMPKLFIPQNKNNSQNTYSVGENENFSAYNKGEDASEIFDLRNYVDGDSPNRIHWKLTSKSDEIIVKDYSSELTLENIVLVDLFYIKDIEQLEVVYELLYSFVQFMVEHETPLVVMYPDVTIGGFQKVEVSLEKEIDEMMFNILNTSTYSDRENAVNMFDILQNTEGVRLFYITGYGSFKKENYANGYIKYIITSEYNKEQECVNKFGLID